MKIPVVPLVIAAALIGAAVYLFNASSPGKQVLGTPRLTRLADIEGIETEAAIAPDGVRCAVIVAGDLWLLDMNDGSRQQITNTREIESFPSWTPDGQGLAFTRGGDTFVVPLDNVHSPQFFRQNATSLTWAASGASVFVRDRGLWLADANGLHERQIVEADPNPDVTLRAPRFSPDSTRIAFIKSVLNLRGEVWLFTIANADLSPLATDRPAENPMDVGWIMEGREIVYLTNRSGAYALWRIDLAENAILPLTVTLDAAPLERIGIATLKDRIVVPRHFVDSNIVLSDGATLAGTADLEFEPSVSPNGTLVAYTVQKDAKFEIWTVGIHGENPAFRTLGRQPRFSPSGFQIVYTNTDPSGNEDVWRIDIRDSASESLTDAQEIDLQPDWSPDGRSIVFASARGGAVSVWEIPAGGGKRLRLNDAGVYPRFFAKGRSISFWTQGAFWTMDANGEHAHRIRDGIPEPAPMVWTAHGPKYYADPEIHGGRRIWPDFDVLPDGRPVTAPINVQETSLWAVDLTYDSQ